MGVILDGGTPATAAPGASVVVPAATNVVEGVIALTGDLGGTAASPTVPALAGKAALIHAHVMSDITDLGPALAAITDSIAAVAAAGGGGGGGGLTVTDNGDYTSTITTTGTVTVTDNGDGTSTIS